MRKPNTEGFTLVEISVSVTLLVIAMALAITGYIYSLKNVNEGDVQNELDIHVQLAMERLKLDLRLSSLDKMFYYPTGSGPYEAISFPLATDTDGDGLLEKDADGKLVWSKTVIYHIRPSTPNQLVVTTFSPRDNSLSDAQRQAQLEDVVRDGDGASTYNGGNASSHVIFKNLLDWEISPKEGRFDAYDASLSRDKSSLGYILLDSGSHDFTFKVIGKNSKSSGYKIGIDQLFVSPSYGAREAEAHLPPKSESGATAADQYMPVGSWKGNHQILFPATGVNASFTLTLSNDQWEETNFGGLGYLAEDTRISFDQSLVPSDYIVELDGMDTSWEASAQTADPAGGNVIPGTMMNWAVRSLIKGSNIAEGGGWLSHNGEECKIIFASSSAGSLTIGNAYIGESAYTNAVNLDYNSSGPIKEITFSGSKVVTITAGTATSDWIEMPIDREKNYVISYTISNDPLQDAPRQWNDYVVDSNPTNSGYWATEVAVNAGHLIQNDRNWNGQGIPYSRTNAVFGIESIYVSYPEEGKYTSQIFDTHVASPQYGYISWNEVVPAGTSLGYKVRTGNESDLSDADSFDSMAGYTDASSASSSRSIGASYSRYIQFQYVLRSSSGGQETPKLKDVTIDWVGERRLVDIGGIFTKGPDYGIFEISVDGQPLRSALIIDLEIYKDITLEKGATRRVTSALKVDLTPRNSGM